MERNILIKGTGTYTPKNEVGNEFFEEYFRRIGVEVHGIMKHLNRQKRFFADRDESSLSMGHEAAVNVLEKMKLDPKELDMIILSRIRRNIICRPNALKLSQMLGAVNAHRVLI